MNTGNNNLSRAKSIFGFDYRMIKVIYQRAHCNPRRSCIVRICNIEGWGILQGDKYIPMLL